MVLKIIIISMLVMRHFFISNWSPLLIGDTISYIARIIESNMESKIYNWIYVEEWSQIWSQTTVSFIVFRAHRFVVWSIAIKQTIDHLSNLFKMIFYMPIYSNLIDPTLKYLCNKYFIYDTSMSIIWIYYILLLR